MKKPPFNNMSKKRPDRFVVGFVDSYHLWGRGKKWMFSMALSTAEKAQRRAKRETFSKPVIYELVPVK